jgi:8-hydroxy-5-deazaflavin:NADPH oxidoreductase
MRVGVLGTGMVGETIASKLVELGHEVMMGSREAGNEKAVAWASGVGERASEGTFADAASFGELIVNATAGMHARDALGMAGAENLAGKTVMDTSNPLDFSKGRPPTLSVVNDDSVGETLQREFGDAHIVKALNTINANLMVDPSSLGEATNIFICGNDSGAKAQVIELLETFGWLSGDILDLGDITASRGVEMYLPLWLNLMGTLGTVAFNVKVVRGED